MGRRLHSLNRQIGALSFVDLRNMRLFRQVADAGGFTAAVDRFGLEKTAISRAVRALEERLDGSLCIRGPKGFALTEYGRQVYAAAASIEDSVDRARIDLNSAHRNFEGEVRLGITDNCLTNVEAKISDSIERFFKIAPAVRFSASIFAADHLLRAIRDREIHLGIVSADHTAGEHLVAEPVFTEQTHLYCCPQDDETAPHLERLRSRGYGVVHRRFVGEGTGRMSRQIDAAWTAEAVGLEAVATLINTGRCVGFLPDHFVAGTRTRRQFIVVPGSEALRITTVFSIVHEKDRVVSQAVSVMRDMFVDTAKQAGTIQRAQLAMAGRESVLSRRERR